MKHGVLLIKCLDKLGIVAIISQLFFTQGANIINADQHSTEEEGGVFFLRLEFKLATELEIADFKQIVEPQLSILEADWQLFDIDTKPRMGIMTSKTSHCLIELLYRHSVGDLQVEIPFIISNHNDVSQTAAHFNIPFHYVPATSSDSKEDDIFSIVQGKADFIVLARYMQILSSDLLAKYDNDIINIHHSFLPAFKGDNPYAKAYDKGVKIIGATAHFVTPNLDEGPIIAQQVMNVSHRDTVASLKHKGKDLEKLTLACAVQSYVDRKVIRYENRTVVFY